MASSTWSRWRPSSTRRTATAAARLARSRTCWSSDAKAAHEALVELVAEGKDELMEEFFAEGTIPEDHLITALHEAIREDRIFPVLYASGLAQCRHRPSARFSEGLCSVADGAACAARCERRRRTRQRNGGGGHTSP